VFIIREKLVRENVSEFERNEIKMFCDEEKEMFLLLCKLIVL
jgi:hypothetical protein